MSFFLLFKPFPQKSSRIFAVFHAFASPAKPPCQSASTIHRRLQCTKPSLTEGGGSRSETEEGGRPMAAPTNRAAGAPLFFSLLSYLLSKKYAPHPSKGTRSIPRGTTLILPAIGQHFFCP
jgi:hypothetical protein